MLKRKTAVSAALLTAPLAGLLLCQPLAAATASDADVSAESASSKSAASSGNNALQEVTVLGQRTTPEVARAAQQQAPNFINLTTADEMQKLPDVNTGEAIRRVPGISLETDTGEGRYINIRGLDADLNSTTFGGLRLPPTNNSSPSGAGRAVAFDSIPIGFVGAIKVTKTNLPEQDAEALGGTIDITPKTVPADGKPFAEVKLGSGKELQRQTSIIDLAGTAGARFGGGDGYKPFSLLITASTYDDRRGIDDAEAAFKDSQAAGIPDKAFAAFEQRYYTYHRERHGYGADFGFDPDENNQYFARYYDAGYRENVSRNLLHWAFSGNPTVDPNDPNGFDDTVTLSKSLRDEREYLDSRVAEVGGKNIFGGGATLDYHVGYTKGTYYKPYDYNSTFTNPTTANAFYDNTTLPDWPVVRVLPGSNVNPASPAGYLLNANPKLDGVNNQSQHSDDNELGVGVNLALPTHWTDRTDEELKFGLNARIRHKTGDLTTTSVNFGALPALPLSSAVYGGNVVYYQDHYPNGPQINGPLMRSVYAAALASGNVSTDIIGDQLASVHDRENVYAGYGQYQFGFGPLGVIAGLRVERTDATYAGYRSDSSNLLASANCPIPDPVNNPTTHVCPVSTDRTYTNYFPSVQVRYEFQPDLIGRAALSSTIARPGFQQITAATTVDVSGNTTTGNPNLKPTTATGLDLSLEKYLPYAGIASVGFFGKNIKDYIAQQVSQQPGGQQKTGGNLGIVDFTSFTNTPSAHLYGFEGNYVQRFKDLLPGPLAGLGVSVNWTWVDSWYKLPVPDPVTGLTTTTRDSILPSTSRNTGNAELLYDAYGLSMTLGAYYTSKNIFGLGNTAALDIWTQERFSVDFGTQYKVFDALTLYFNAKNLTNTPVKFTEGPGENRIIQREFYGVTLQFGGILKF
jgi:TonB-dependent receptor